MPDTADDVDLLSEDEHFLGVEFEHSDEAAEVVGAEALVLLLLSALVLSDTLAPSIDLKNSGHAVFVQVGHDYELLRVHPNGDGLQIQLLL